MEYRRITEVGTTPTKSADTDGVEFRDKDNQLVARAECWPPELAFVLTMILGRDAEALDRIAMFCSAEDRRLGT